MGLKIVLYYFNCGFSLYYCSDNRLFEGEVETIYTEDIRDLIEVINNYPFVKLSW
uniref:P6.5 protein n=1 Tax=croton golden spot associated virus C TaxID=3072822 RepID=A0AA50I0K0_9CLOS|nr:p6.5 protein [croton golden spot associated virus C]